MTYFAGITKPHAMIADLKGFTGVKSQPGITGAYRTICLYCNLKLLDLLCVPTNPA